MKTKKIHLVCSSGGVRCFSYIGVVNRLYKEGINIESISACSMGTVIGALIASGLELKEIEKRIINFNFSLLRTKRSFSMFRIFKSPFATHDFADYEKIMIDLLGENMTLSQLKIPFSALALDIRQKRFLVYSSETHPNMKISEVVKIATSIPFMYPPYKLDKHLLVDAAVATESPIWMAVNQKGHYPIIVLRTSKPLNIDYNKSFLKYLANLISVSAESHDYFAASQIDRSIDITINCGNIGYADFSITSDDIENLILEGESAAENQLKAYNYDFDNILAFNENSNIEEIQDVSKTADVAEEAARSATSLADKMISGFRNEILNRDQIFVSYSHLDKEWLNKLNKSLRAIERFTGIKAWSDKLIMPGDRWHDEIEKSLSTAKVAVFLVTENFLASQFIQENEMNYFLEINRTEKVPILWIAVGHSLYNITPLKDIQCANDPKKPLDTMTESEQSLEIIEICKKIIELMK